jgi:hypothetical protein
VKAHEGSGAFLREYLRQHFERHGRKTVETRRFRITHATNSGVLPVLVDVQADLLPEAYRKAYIRYSPDLDTLREALDRSLEVTDAAGRTVARYGERGSSIRIR